MCRLLRLLLIGAAGVALGLMLAPKAGWELRAELGARLRSLISGETEPLYVTPAQGWENSDLGSEVAKSKIEETRARLREQLGEKDTSGDES